MDGSRGTACVALGPVDPALRADVRYVDGRAVVRLRSGSLARFVETTLSGAPDTVFSDDHFDLPAGRDVGITCATPSGGTSERVQDAIEVRTLYDTFTRTERR